MGSRLFLTAICLFLSSSAFAKRLVPVDITPHSNHLVQVIVSDEKGPLAQAQVWIETASGKLLAELTSDINGKSSFQIPSGLSEPLNVTAFAADHSAVSLLATSSATIHFELPKNIIDSYSTLTGKLTGFQERTSGKASVGLVAKALELADLAQLETSAFISPLKDSIDLYGRREIPSNIVLPEQSVFFARVEKPIYRLPVVSGSSSRYFGITAEADTNDALDAIRSKDPWALIDLMEFKTVGVLQNALEIPVKSNQSIKLDLHAGVALNNTLKLTSDQIVNTASNGAEVKHLAAALWEAFPGVFVPTDIKQVQDNGVQLQVLDKKSAQILDVLVADDASQFRGVWVPQGVSKLPPNRLGAGLTLQSLEGVWSVSGAENTHWLVARAEEKRKTSLGTTRYEERWVVVSPKSGVVQLPSAATQKLRNTLLGNISHVSVDLLRMHGEGYPISAPPVSGQAQLLRGDTFAGDVSSLEKIRREIHR